VRAGSVVCSVRVVAAAAVVVMVAAAVVVAVAPAFGRHPAVLTYRLKSFVGKKPHTQNCA
jgi:hypothetical protein